MRAKYLRTILPTNMVFVFSALILIAAGFSVSAQSKQGGAQEQDTQFGGTYANLNPAQRLLIDEWFRQYNELAKQNLKPAEEYDELSLSVRTTFEAVTHALMTTKLTDQQGGSLATALDVISNVETIHGKVPTARGDLQFRIYVALKPTALQTLDDSREFKRGKDNTIYHKGYPLNYRQQGGVPSIQISSSPDGKRADIDVDYRSAKFPAALVNGHLTAANSDVRAGKNHGRHVNRWSGFANWWQSMFGVPLKKADLKDEEIKGGGGSIPKIPRAGKSKPEEAVYDFLNAWLVEQQLNQAVAYISPSAYPCIVQVASDEKRKINEAVSRYYILEGMKRVNRAIGRQASLTNAAESVNPNNPALKIINQPHSAEFDLFETPEDIAFDFECANRNRLHDEAETKKPERKYGKYYVASLRLKTLKAKGELLLILLAKETDYWKIVSWNVDPDELENEKAPNTVAAMSETKSERVTGDPGLIADVQGFFDAWFVKQNFDQAVGYLSEQCYPCINLNRGEGERKAQDWPEGRQMVLAGMKKVAGVIGRKSEVDQAIESIAPAHPALKLVPHSQERAYSLVSVPDEIARAFECQEQVQGAKVGQKVGASAVYGNYYGVLFELNIPGSPAALRLLWGREKGQWKITAYSIEVP